MQNEIILIFYVQVQKTQINDEYLNIFFSFERLQHHHNENFTIKNSMLKCHNTRP